jgi:hypothetical protein
MVALAGKDVRDVVIASREFQRDPLTRIHDVRREANR